MKPCPLHQALNVIGDKWSLLLLRDLLQGPKRYSAFCEQEGIPTNILAARLKRLQEAGLLTKQPYQQQPVRYEYLLTAKGAALLPAIQKLAEWGMAYTDSSTPPEAFFSLTAAQVQKAQAS
ncbi:winged helix-turn-helix transcriptional regulator [Bowmanella pacifica]|uniref:HTH hxlR-type domain-containing protein n=1 Tax=Bowmanella pacifica TaxID=502051 RepID=A0A917Z3M4_9ALTE|nr:helix-turn-helix domain-containing protein [Bowmanella pacifica]GGO71995.1 hypothetical protein GCM10010982_29070 [Bowmanella pacifica]